MQKKKRHTILIASNVQLILKLPNDSEFYAFTKFLVFRRPDIFVFVSDAEEPGGGERGGAGRIGRCCPEITEVELLG